MSRVTLDLQQVNRSFSGLKLLAELNLKMESPSKIAIIGENGCGKTTLLKILAGQLCPCAGEIYLNKLQVNESLILKKNISYLPSDGEVFPRLTGLENIETMSSFDQEVNFALHKKMIAAWSENLIFKKALETPGYLMSSGMKQMILIYKSLLRGCPVYVFDEPWRYLSQKSINFIATQINEEFQGALFVIATHQVNQLDGFYDQIYKISEGQCHAV